LSTVVAYKTFHARSLQPALLALFFAMAMVTLLVITLPGYTLLHTSWHYCSTVGAT